MWLATFIMVWTFNCFLIVLWWDKDATRASTLVARCSAIDRVEHDVAWKSLDRCSHHALLQPYSYWLVVSLASWLTSEWANLFEIFDSLPLPARNILYNTCGNHFNNKRCSPYNILPFAKDICCCSINSRLLQHRKQPNRPKKQYIHIYIGPTFNYFEPGLDIY